MEFGNCTSGGSFRRREETAPGDAGTGGLPLTMARIGETGTIVKIVGDDDTRKFLTNLGFTAGSEVTVVGRLGKSMIVDIKGSRIAMDSTAASGLHYVPM